MESTSLTKGSTLHRHARGPEEEHYSSCLLESISLGDDSAGVTPLPIPNRVVKPRCADGTASELVWQSR